MSDFTWRLAYQSDLQSFYALLVIPFAFLVYRIIARPDRATAINPAATRFVAVLTIVFAVETMIDPFSTGPLLKHTRLGDSLAASAIPFLFVYLGDFRVLLLAKGVSDPQKPLGSVIGWAVAMTIIVPIFAGAAFTAVGTAFPEIHGQVLWILYEFGFFSLCVWLSRVWLPRQVGCSKATCAYLRAVLGFSAAYYALWLAADLLIVYAGLDLGWAIRIVPNQLYYAVWVPFVYARFFSRPLEGLATSDLK